VEITVTAQQGAVEYLTQSLEAQFLGLVAVAVADMKEAVVQPVMAVVQAVGQLAQGLQAQQTLVVEVVQVAVETATAIVVVLVDQE
jgi:hypothetical protein